MLWCPCTMKSVLSGNNSQDWRNSSDMKRPRQLNSLSLAKKTFMLSINHNNSTCPALNINSKAMFVNLPKMLFLACNSFIVHCAFLTPQRGERARSSQVHNSVLLKWEADLDGVLRCVVWHIVKGADGLTCSLRQTAPSSFEGPH